MVAVELLTKRQVVWIIPHFISFVNFDQTEFMNSTGMRETKIMPRINFIVAKIEEQMTAIAITARNLEWTWTINESHITESDWMLVTIQKLGVFEQNY